MRMSLAEAAKMTDGELEGSAEAVMEGAAGLGEAGPKDISFLENLKYSSRVLASQAGCVFLPLSVKGMFPPAQGPKNRIYVAEAKWAFAQVLNVIEEESFRRPPPLIDARAVVHYQAQLGRNVGIGAFTVVEQKAVVAEGAFIGPQCYIGANARIGKNCRIYPQVVIREGCVVGERSIIHSGTVIGSDGFGYATDPKTGRHRKVPQIGDVVIEDDVEIGSNVSIDRATTGSTCIGSGTKIDNLVQIAHNVRIGRNCLVVSQAGIAGSTKIGDQVVLAGQAGVVGHLTIGDGAIITAQTGVMGDVEPNAVLFGSPARPHREAMKLQALINKLPEIYDTLKEIGRKAGVSPRPKRAQAARREGDHAQR